MFVLSRFTNNWNGVATIWHNIYKIIILFEKFQKETSVFTPTLKIVELCVANSQCITMFQQYISLY